jgi:dimethylargininase
MLIAVTRAVSPTLAQCELTHLPRDPIDVAAAVAQHAQYEAALGGLGAKIVRAPPEPALPDAVFVEDTALVLDEVAIITRPGAQSRRAEIPSIANTLKDFRSLIWIQEPGTIDGGDILRVGRMLYVGVSSRTNLEGIALLETAVRGSGYEVTRVPLTGCLHLKSAVTQVAEDLLLINSRWVRPNCFGGMRTTSVAPAEPAAANALWVSGADAVIFPEHHPQTAERLSRAGVRVISVPCAELAKAEGGVTCCSLLFQG